QILYRSRNSRIARSVPTKAESYSRFSSSRKGGISPSRVSTIPRSDQTLSFSREENQIPEDASHRIRLLRGIYLQTVSLSAETRSDLALSTSTREENTTRANLAC